MKLTKREVVLLICVVLQGGVGWWSLRGRVTLQRELAKANQTLMSIGIYKSPPSDKCILVAEGKTVTSCECPESLK